MSKIFKITSIIFLLIFFFTQANSKENFFDEALKMYQSKKYEDARFVFERNIVFNPKDAKSYLYLAKIYNVEKNLKEEEKNLKTTLLLDPRNEEATYMIIEIELKKSNYSKVKELIKTFAKICKKMCEKEKSVLDSLKNLEPKNES